MPENKPSPWKQAAAWLAARQIPLALALLAGLTCMLWSVATPPWRAPDEPQHFGYIQFLSRERTIPVEGRAFLYPDEIESLSRTNFSGATGSESTYIDPAAQLPNPAAVHPPLYYSLMLPFYLAAGDSPVETQLYVVRLAGSLLFAGLIVAAYLLARAAFPRSRYLQIGVPLLMIFHPQLAFISSAVMNDSLLALLFTLFLYHLVTFARGDASLRRAAFIGVTIGLGMLVKSSFMMAFPIALAVAAGMFAFRPALRMRIVKAGALVLAVSAAICAWYYVRTYLELGVWLPVTPGQRYNASGWLDLFFGTAFVTDLLTGFLGNFSWLSMPLPKEAVLWFMRLVIVSLAGLAAAVTLGVLRPSWRAVRTWIAALLVGVLCLFALSAAYYELKYSGAQGRYMFPVDFALWSVVLVGLTGWMPPSWRPRAASGVVALAAVFSTWALFHELIGRVT